MCLTYSAASAASVSASNEPECEQLRSAKSTRSVGPFSPSTGQMLLATTTCEPLPQIVCEQMALPAMSSVADSHAKTFPEPETVLGSLAKGQDYGLTSRASLASFDRLSRLWKTSQRCLIETWERFAGAWPKSGMMQNGQLYPLAPLVRHTCDNECSLWPTPTASMDGRGFGIPLHDRTGRYKKSTVSRVHALVGEHGWRIHPSFTETLMGFPLGWTEIEPLEIPLSRKSRR